MTNMSATGDTTSVGQLLSGTQVARYVYKNSVMS